MASKYSIGDKVKVVNCCLACNGRVVTVQKVWDLSKGFDVVETMAHNDYWDYEVEPLNQTEKNMSSVIERIKDLTIGEPLKSFVKYGIKEKDGSLTSDGKEVLLDILATKYEGELINLVDQLKAEDKASK